MIWLDIDYSSERRYFTWNKEKFPNPKGLVSKLKVDKRRLVTIIDPHVKVDEGYFLYEEAKAKGLLVRDSEGSEYNDTCWPLSSGWLDFLNEET